MTQLPSAAHDNQEGGSMAERMTNEEFEEGATRTHITGMWQHVKPLLEEARAARREEAQQQDRIHALEVQQADLIRQVKELKKAISSTRDSALAETRAKILKSADLPEYFRRNYEGEREAYEAAGRGYAAGVNHALDALAAMRTGDVP